MTTPAVDAASLNKSPRQEGGSAKESESQRLTRLFRRTRAATQNLASTLEPDDFVVQTAPYTSPVKWHIGHVSWIYEAVMGKIDPKYGFKEGEVSAYLNSYYQQFGKPHDKANRGIVPRPTTSKMLEYFEQVSQKVEGFIAKHADVINLGSAGGRHPTTAAAHDGSEVSRLLEMGVHHECQHQELMVYDLQHMLSDRYVTPGGAPAPVKKEAVKWQHVQEDVRHMQVPIEGGIYPMGYGGSKYCYDIELPEHKVYLEPYMIDAHPITNAQYMEFVEDGGYDTYRYWLADGWEKASEDGWEAPMYWERAEDCSGAWHTRDFAGFRMINPREPVCHVSYYEADAYCKWAKKRLPTEAEWEKAACWDNAAAQKREYPWGDDAPTSERCNLLESGMWRCAEVGSYPSGASAYGCQQMIGDVWEWTSSEFSGYPGFRSGFDEYNDKWFSGQKVLRGGSFGTPGISIRASYRNFFRPDERWMMSGLRCASDAQ